MSQLKKKKKLTHFSKEIKLLSTKDYNFFLGRMYGWWWFTKYVCLSKKAGALIMLLVGN